MYGLVNSSLQEMVEREWGSAVWAEIRAEAGVQTEVFISLEGYPDDVTYRLVTAASRRTGRDPEDLLRDFGRHWVLETAGRHYRYLLTAGGRNFGDFLRSLPNLHTRVSLHLPDLVPPEFRCEEMGDGSMILHYRSTRENLAAFVEGLLDGLAVQFLVQAAWVRRPDLSTGPRHTVFEVRWQGPVP